MEDETKIGAYSLFIDKEDGQNTYMIVVTEPWDKDVINLIRYYKPQWWGPSRTISLINLIYKKGVVVKDLMNITKKELEELDSGFYDKYKCNGMLRKGGNLATIRYGGQI
ncbi:hypothetical protein KAR91_07200 [Candidatus Pacearchaeota archaeon]|nr:hypothetical protein [Candidatus Pacearchaeota archaeon]